MQLQVALTCTLCLAAATDVIIACTLIYNLRRSRTGARKYVSVFPSLICHWLEGQGLIASLTSSKYTSSTLEHLLCKSYRNMFVSFMLIDLRLASLTIVFTVSFRWVLAGRFYSDAIALSQFIFVPTSLLFVGLAEIQSKCKSFANADLLSTPDPTFSIRQLFASNVRRHFLDQVLDAQPLMYVGLMQEDTWKRTDDGWLELSIYQWS